MQPYGLKVLREHSVDGWIDGWMGHLSPFFSLLFFPSLQCAAVMPPSLKLRGAKVGKNFIHRDCQLRGERPITEQCRKGAASDWSVTLVGGKFTV
ncbi:hypothetical protein QQF64_018042 [Cirrhinus molitorella]|uniref:Uncharacterized protein n=1 Tax=Cirrhinus molitorella TaxID=172907 RepID=A0ABR3LNS9_9TELE